MIEVKRYESGVHYCSGDAMVQSKEGDYVSYEDYAALKAECESKLKSAQYSAETNRKISRKNGEMHDEILSLKAECENWSNQCAALIKDRDALAAKVKQLEWDSVFIPKNLDQALTVMGVSLPVSKEQFNFEINRWMQRLVDRVIRNEPDFSAYANQLRAEGVEMFALYLAETAIKEGADLNGWKSTASNEACDYAANLRKENGHD